MNPDGQMVPLLIELTDDLENRCSCPLENQIKY